MRAGRIFPPFLRRLAGDERGVSVVEMALFAPILAVFALSIGDLGRAFAERYALQQTVHRTLERGHITGPTGGTYSYLSAEASAAAGTGSTVTINEWVECTATNGTRRRVASTSDCAPATSTDPAEEFARYVELTISKNYTPMFTGSIFAQRNGDGTVPLQARASIRVQ